MALMMKKDEIHSKLFNRDDADENPQTTCSTVQAKVTQSRAECRLEV